MPANYSEEMLEEMLNAEGMVISTRILRNQDGSSRCVGFARMHSKECCDAIISVYLIFLPNINFLEISWALY